jgi:hypothetical protein
VRVRRWIGAIGAMGLTLLGAAYWLTCEPAPRIRVLWRPEVIQEQRAALERKYLLLNGRDQLPEGSIAYDLLDTSRANLQAIVNDPSILDTNDIERNSLIVPFDVEYGSEWMWLADRIPGLRNVQLRAAIVIALAAMVIGGLGPDAVLVWRGVRDGRRPGRDA